MSSNAVASPSSAPAVSLGALRTGASIGRLHIVSIAALGLLTFGWIFTGKHLWTLAAICAGDWFVVNLLNRVVDLREDRANAIVGTNFVAAHRRAVLVIGFGLLAVSFPITHVFFPQMTLLRTSFHALGFAYNWPLLPGRRRIKQLYFFKNAASAAGFMITVFGYPLAVSTGFADGISALSVLALGLFFFLFELSYEVLYDLRDVPGDRLADVRTYPVVHGERIAGRIASLLMLASMVVLAGAYAAHLVPWRAFVLIAGPLLQWVVYARRSRTLNPVDCIRMTWIGAALLLAYQLWVALGLPLEL